MKKLFFFAVISAAATITTATSLSYFNKIESSDLLNANVEALADGEIHVGIICRYTEERICYTIDDDLGLTFIMGYEE
ncbi:NVEALA domain-containing protein [uncultured Alistipes sp.]|uniref:NVEALA domain-containing protein n=1 Tax=uncultured Alistipes sp. TaxID=538949 RepID=UPI0026324704|nr:NVEALA domain-containing protein [uncultured Alistipes sp.]